MAARMANIRRPIKRPQPPIAKSTLRRRDELLSEVLFFFLIYHYSRAHYPRTVSISASVILVNIVSGSRKVRAGRVKGLSTYILSIMSFIMVLVGSFEKLDNNTGVPSKTPSSSPV